MDSVNRTEAALGKRKMVRGLLVRREFEINVQGVVLYVGVESKVLWVLESFISRWWMWAADESFFSFIFSDDAKPHKAKPNAAYYTRSPLFRGNFVKIASQR